MDDDNDDDHEDEVDECEDGNDLMDDLFYFFPNYVNPFLIILKY